MEMLTASDADGEYRIPNIIYADAYSSEMVAYADLVLPDTTYLERHDCISLLDRPISEPDAAGDAIRWPVRRARPRRARLPVGAARPRRAPAPARHGRARRQPDLPRLRRLHRPPPAPPRRRAARRLARRRRRRGPRRARTPTRSSATSRTAASGSAHVPEEAAYFKPWNAAYQDWAVAMGFFDAPQPYLFQLYSEPLGRFQAAALGKGDRQPPAHLRERLARAMAPLPVWYPPRSDATLDPDAVPAPRDHPAPGGDVPLLGLAERLAAPDPRREPASTSPARSGRRSASSRATGPTSSRRTAASPCRSPAWTRRTRIRSGPGTPSASAPAPGRSPGRPGGHPRLPAQPPDPRPPPRREAGARPTPTRSPARPPGTTSASASSASPPAPAPPPPSRPRPRPSAADRRSSPSAGSGTGNSATGARPFPAHAA